LYETSPQNHRNAAVGALGINGGGLKNLKMACNLIVKNSIIRLLGLLEKLASAREARIK
jgi:hypothetical protein